MSNNNVKTRLLLVLWGLSQENALVKQSELTKRFGKKTPEFESALTELQTQSAIVLEKEKRLQCIKLTPAGFALLAAGILNTDFAFEGSVVGSRLANALLAWLRINNTPSSTDQEVAVIKISSYDEFQTVFLEVYDRLNLDFNCRNLVPIYKIRRAIGDRVTRDQFREWTIKMQMEDIVLLREGTVEDSTRDKIEDSITTPINGLRCYATKN